MKLIADMHMHTNVSHHAFSTLSEMCEAACKRGLKIIAVTNHGPKLPDGAHPWHFDSLTELPRIIMGVFVLRGVEANILDEDGTLDLPEDILAKLDFVIASFHGPTFPDPTFEKCTNAMESILRNPHVNLLGHMGTPRFAFDYERIVSQCRQYGKAIELNGSSPDSRQGSVPCCTEIARLCRKYSVPVFIDSDSHFDGNLGLSELALPIAKAAELPQELVINADIARLTAYLEQHCGIDPGEFPDWKEKL